MTEKQAQKTDMQSFLFEIGVEELPASFIQIASACNAGTDMFSRVFHEAFTEARIAYEQFQVFVTPRRITFAAQVAVEQTATIEVFRGPSKEKAFSEDGTPTKALQGFIRGKGIGVDDIEIRDMDKGSYVIARIQHAAGETAPLLPTILNTIVTSLSFPKMMKWNSTQLRFPRPIRWLVGMYGSATIGALQGSCMVAGVPVGTTTYGHRFLSEGTIEITSADVGGYIAALEKVYVIVDQIVPAVTVTKREQMIIDMLRAVDADQKNAIDTKFCDYDLVKTVANLVEYPEMIIGDFGVEYLDLPHTVLSASMKKHQKVLACFDADKNMLPHFIAIINGKRKPDAIAQIKAGYRNVLEARLRDAQFFYNEDRKTLLSDKVEQLAGIVFLGKLGTVYDKVKRLEKYAENVATFTGFVLSADEQKFLMKSALLAKADLVTHMVYEFPELQGEMGRIYAENDGEGDSVAQAVFEHYLPRSKDDDVPITKIGALLAIFDKIDTLCGAFLLGMEPTGSQDPYALRRAAIGIVRILKQHSFSLSLSNCIDFGCMLFAPMNLASGQEHKGALRAFIEDKVQFVFVDDAEDDRDRELLQAVMQTSCDDIASLNERYAFIKKYTRQYSDIVSHVAKICERTHNIIKNNTDTLSDIIDTSLFDNDSEKKLYLAYTGVIDTFHQAYTAKKFDVCMRLYHDALYEVVDEFFDKTLVNVEDEQVRINRKSLMQLINELFTRHIGDLCRVHF